MPNDTKSVAPLQQDAKTNSVSSFLQDVHQAPAIHKAKQRGRVIFALDATMSRAPTWRMARQVQSEMFAAAEEVGGLDVQIVFFRGQGELRKSAWTRSPATLADRMARVQCRGGLTQISRVLKHTERESADQPVHALIYIGDAVEENPDVISDLAGQLALRNCKIFAFQEGRDVGAERVFREMARMTQGAYARFDAASAETLKALLRAVGAYAAGGIQALKKLAAKDRQASLLLTQMPDNHSGSV
ncbi:MAG: VWA domain-containing protein [Pseudomonadota bacterium]